MDIEHCILHACHRGCLGQHPIKLPQCSMYKRYDEMQVMGKVLIIKGPEETITDDDEEDPNQHVVLQSSSSC